MLGEHRQQFVIGQIEHVPGRGFHGTWATGGQKTETAPRVQSGDMGRRRVSPEENPRLFVTYC